MIKKVICLVFLVLMLFNADATHVSGGDISYTCLGGNVYLVSLKLFRDCSGINLGTTQSIKLTNDCGFSNQYFTASIVSDPVTGLNYSNISQLCSTDSVNSTCYSGALPGMQQFTYQATITLTQTCDAFRFSWRVCCRNSSTNLVGQSAPYFEVSLNNVDAICNNSPVFTGAAIPYVCVNQPVAYSYGVVESDGDDLRYSLISARSNTGSLVNYQSSYSGTSPIVGIAIDSLSGELTFTPTILGNFVVVVNVKEYNSSGVLICEIIRDMQFIVQSCANNVGNYSTNTFNNISGAVTVHSLNILQVIEGDSFCVDLTFADGDVTDVLSLSSNVTSVLPGSTFNWVSSGNSATATICWKAISGMASINLFTIEINDNACPLPGISSYTVQVNVVPILPIELLDFYVSADPKNKLVNIEWLTSSEINNDYFFVQRSQNANDWETIGKVRGAGNSNDNLYYQIQDLKPLIGVSYYQLKQFDFDGSSSFSQIEAIEFVRNQNLTIYPNPTKGVLYVANSKLVNLPIEILDAMGQVVKKYYAHSDRLDLSEFESGLYFLRVDNAITKIFLTK